MHASIFSKIYIIEKNKVHFLSAQEEKRCFLCIESSIPGRGNRHRITSDFVEVLEIFRL